MSSVPPSESRNQLCLWVKDPLYPQVEGPARRWEPPDQAEGAEWIIQCPVCLHSQHLKLVGESSLRAEAASHLYTRPLVLDVAPVAGE